MYKWVKPLAFLCTLSYAKKIFKSLKALNDRSFVTVVTRIAENICKNFDVITEKHPFAKLL